MRIRTITAGASLRDAEDVAPVARALDLVERAEARMREAGYEVQTRRVATTAFLAGKSQEALTAALPALIALDRLAASRRTRLSIGPIVIDHRIPSDLPGWVAALMATTTTTNTSVRVASAEAGVHHEGVAAAASVIARLATVAPGGLANFRFAGAALIPAGTPFFPVAYHDGAASIAIGLESAGLVHEVFAAGGSRGGAEGRLRDALNAALGRVEDLGIEIAAKEGVRYLGIDASPAPGPDVSIAGALQAFSGVPFGMSGTLEACALVTSALKGLAVRTCGYSGLMLPVLEDHGLAARAAERGYTVQDLLLFSSVCGTGLDVLPLPGDATVEALGRLIGDVATLAVRLRKPLGARLFPIPGRAAGEVAHFDDPDLIDSTILPLP